MKTYYISHIGQQYGPWTRQEILSKIESKEIDWTDYVYDESKSDWCLLTEFSDLVTKTPDSLLQGFNEVKVVPIAEQREQKEKEEAAKDWFVLKQESKYGPFSYFEVIKMLQSKNLFEFDFVWNAKMPEWKKVSECEYFSVDKIRELKSSNLPEIDEVFFRRRHVRVKYGASVIVHNNKKVWKGRSVELSSGGAGIILDNSSLEVGENLFLHFKVGDHVPPFNAICTIVSRHVQSAAGGLEARYGLKFTTLSRDARYAIKNFTDKAA